MDEMPCSPMCIVLISARKPAPGTCSLIRPSASYESLATSSGMDKVSVRRMLRIHIASSTLELP
jgi:hypothetical protein